MRDASDYCKQLVREADKDRFLATLFAPPPLRGPLFALYAFNVEIARIGAVARQPLAGEIRLQWWRDALEGTRREEARGNPVAAALLDAADAHALSVARLLDLVDVHTFDVYDEPMRSMTELENYLAGGDGTLVELAAHVLGASGADVAAAARHAGIGYGIAALLSGLARETARGRNWLPRDTLALHHARPDDLRAAQPSPPFLSALAELRAQARRHLAELRPLLANLPPQAGPAFLPVALVEPMLARLERRGGALPAPLPQWRRQWMLWRAARRGLARLV